MKRSILTLLAAASLAAVSAQNYQVVVTTKNGDTHTIATDKVENIRFIDTPEYYQANTYLGGLYNLATGKDYGLYSFTIGTGAPDEEGDPANIGDFQVALAIWAPISAEAHNAMIPDGYYTGSASGNINTFDVQKSVIWTRVEEGVDGIESSFIIGGNVDVRHDGNNYDIRATLNTVDGNVIDVAYYGQMEFAVGSGAAGELEEDVDIDFTIAQGRVWANWFNPFADDAALYMFTGNFDENGNQTDGYYLNLDMYLPKNGKHEAGKPLAIDDGVYNVDPRQKIISNTYLPYTLRQGQYVDVFGTPMLTGTYLTYTTPQGQISAATIVSGTLTVSNNGTHYEMDLVATNGIHVRGSYDAAPYLMNFIDNSGKPIIDGIDNDVALDFLPNTMAVAYNLGDYIIPGLNSFVLMIAEPNMESGDYLAFDIFCNADEMQDGVYTIDDSMENFTGLKGVYDFGGSNLFSWYGDLDIVDDEGYHTEQSPICGGTFTISTIDAEAGIRKIVFDLTEYNGHKITGEWTGNIVNYVPEPEAKVQHKRNSAIKPIRRTWSGGHKQQMSLRPQLLK